MLLDGYGLEIRFVTCNGTCIIDMWLPETQTAGHNSPNIIHLLLFCHDVVYKTHCHIHSISIAFTVFL